MALVQVQVDTKWTDTVPADLVVNTLHFSNGAPDPLNDTDYNAIAADVKDAFVAFFTPVDGGGFTRGFDVRAYELDDAKPRNPRGTSSLAPGAAESAAALGPRQVACCLSYFSGLSALNKRARGRIYLGPFTNAIETANVAAVILTHAPDLVTALGAVGGSDIEWVTFSRVGAGHAPVSHWHMDNRWDTIRGRLKKATSRIQGTSGG